MGRERLLKIMGLIGWLFIQLNPEPVISETKSGFSFLNIGVGARPIGLGSAYTALADDINSIYWNPAGLSSLRHKELSLMHGLWLANSSFDFMGYGRPTSYGAVALSVSNLAHPQLEERDITGQKTGGFNARDTAFSLAFSRNWTSHLQAGLGLKFIQSQISTYKGQGFSLDIGSMYQFSSLSFGFSLQNIGPGITFIAERTKLPLTASLGSAYHILPNLSLACDFKRQIYDKTNHFSLGTEYRILPLFALRGGYLLNRSNPRFNSLGAGFGIAISGHSIDYALTPFGELGSTHRLSLTVRY